MKTRSFFILAALCLLFGSVLGQAPQLNRRISLQVKDATLEQVLQKIQRKYAVRFSYLNNSLPANQLFSAEIKDKPLSEVLDVLLSQTEIGYLEKNGQVIIKKGLPKKQPKTTTLKKLPVPAPEPAPKTVKTSPAPSKKNEPAAGSSVKVAEQEVAPAPETAPAPNETTAQTAATGNPENNSPETVAAPADTTTQKRDGITITLKNPFPKWFDADSTEIQPYHLGLIFPVSNHGINASRYVNRYSLHLLVGTAAGLKGFEMSGVGNLEKKYVKGLQFAGVFNVVGNPDWQVSDTGSSQYRYSLQGGQVAGVVNVARGPADGAQIAGVVNVARDLDGAQIAGVVNHARRVNGVQISGLLNKAGSVAGSQIGLINISDSISGIPFGLINIVKKNGYRRLEAYYADDFEANLTYKIGVHRFYNLIAVGAQLQGEKRWGYGAGLGAEWQPFRFLHLNTDLLSYYVIEDSYENFPDGLFENYQLNLLNKFRLLGSLQLSQRVALFGGPVYNVMVSEHVTAGETSVGSSLPRHPFYDRTSGGTNVKMWIGFNAGIRF